MMEDQLDPNYDGASNGDDAELYLLKWNSHQNHFANKFSELLDEDDISFADVTLACEGHFLQAHRLVLSVCSPFFKNLFKVNAAEKGPATIVLANVRFQDLENILHFIYRGQVNVRKDDLAKFLETGEQLQIDGLMGQYEDNTKPRNSFKRRYSEGGHVLPKPSPQPQSQSRNVYMVNRNTTTTKSQGQQGQYRTVAGNTASRIVTQNSQVIESAEKKPRISPSGTLKQDTSSLSAPRRPSSSTTAGVQNSSNSSSPQHPTKVDEISPVEMAETSNGNGIKILTVATINSQVAAANAAAYDEQGNEVFEILDYDEDNGDGGENELEMDEMMASYEDGGDDSVYYYQQSTSPYVRTSASNSQASRGNPNVTARYPSIIDGVHFDLISADEKRVAAQCKLCPGDKVIRGSGLTSSNFISHLRAFHKRELEEWREKRKTETRRRLD